MTITLLQAFIFLCAGVIAVPLASRLGLGSVLGYLLAGIAIAPLLRQIDVDVAATQHFAEFGVVMMLFLVGLELEPRVLWSQMSRLLGLGGLQVTGSTVLVMAVAMAMGQPFTVALAVGFILSLSSTAIVLQTLNERGLMQSDAGRAGFSVLLFQDIAVIPMLAFIPLLAMPELMDLAATGAGEAADASGHTTVDGPHQSASEANASAMVHGTGTQDGGGHGEISLVEGLAGWQAMLVTLAAIAIVIYAGRRLTAPLFRFISMAGLRELFTAAALMVIIAIALLMSLVGLSPALGTFIAGVVLAESEYKHELEADIDPFRGLLLGLFFMTVGARIDFALLAGELALIVGLTGGLIALKMLVMLALTVPFKLRSSDRWLFALALAQAGEFGFVLISFALDNAVLPASVADRLLLVVALSMLLTPLLFILFDRVIAPRFASRQGEADQIDEPCAILIAGHGRFGGIINRMLRSAGYQTTVIDYSSAQLDMLRTFNVKVYFGDATRPDLLHAAGIQDAKLLIVAIDDKQQITELVRWAVRSYPKLHVTARAVDRLHVYDLYSVGCRDIIRETYDSSIRAGRSALEALGVDGVQARRMAAEFDAADRRSMIEVAPLYDINIPPLENKPYIERVRQVMAAQEAQLRGTMWAGTRDNGTADGAVSDPDAGAPATPGR
jgi:CPA2 family monovalent cation:H+ antiporter-2